MAVRESRRSRPLCAKLAETLPEERLPLPRGYLIYALAAQTGLCDTDRRAAPGPPRPWRRSPSSTQRQYLVLVQVASLNIRNTQGKRIATKRRKKHKVNFCAFCAFFLAKTKLP